MHLNVWYQDAHFAGDVCAAAQRDQRQQTAQGGPAPPRSSPWPNTKTLGVALQKPVSARVVMSALVIVSCEGCWHS